jgi:membrane protein implicated in regulation of membrane protease activity
MLTVYLVALAIGGTLLVASMLMGAGGGAVGEVDADADHGADPGADPGADNAHDADLGAVLAWLPIASLRFWTFFVAFFGLTGTLLTVLEVLGSKVAVGVIAGAVGWVTGTAVVRVLRALRARQTDSTVGEADYVGCVATVMVPVAKGKPGKVRFEVKGRQLEMLAETEDAETYAIRQKVMVYAVADDGQVLVTRSDQLAR